MSEGLKNTIQDLVSTCPTWLGRKVSRIGLKYDLEQVDNTDLDSLAKPLEEFLASPSFIDPTSKAWTASVAPTSFGYSRANLSKPEDPEDAPRLFEHTKANGYQTVIATSKLTTADDAGLDLPVKIALLSEGEQKVWTLHMEDDGPVQRKPAAKSGTDVSGAGAVASEDTKAEAV